MAQETCEPGEIDPASPDNKDPSIRKLSESVKIIRENVPYGKICNLHKLIMLMLGKIHGHICYYHKDIRVTK